MRLKFLDLGNLDRVRTHALTFIVIKSRLNACYVFKGEYVTGTT